MSPMFKLFPKGRDQSLDVAVLASTPRDLRGESIDIREFSVARVVISRRAEINDGGLYFQDLKKGQQEACLLVATPEGGIPAFGRLGDPTAPNLKKGDLVHWEPLEWRSPRDFPDPAIPRWSGDIVALLDENRVPMQVFRPAPLGRG